MPRPGVKLRRGTGCDLSWGLVDRPHLTACMSIRASDTELQIRTLPNSSMNRNCAPPETHVKAWKPAKACGPAAPFETAPCTAKSSHTGCLVLTHLRTPALSKSPGSATYQISNEGGTGKPQHQSLQGRGGVETLYTVLSTSVTDIWLDKPKI